MGKIDTVTRFNPCHLASHDTEKPVLYISRSELRKNSHRFLQHFPGETTYAVKANSNTLVLQELVRNGVSTFDVASIPEMKMVKAVHPQATLHYHNPVHSQREIELAYFEYGCKRFAVDHIDELRKIHSIVPNPAEIELAVRFCTKSNAKAVMAFKSKFGALKLEAVRILQEARRLGFMTGLTFHPGSQTTSAAPYIEHIIEAAEIAHLAGKKLFFLNVGGGFPAHYEGLETAQLETYFEAIRKTTINVFGKEAPKLECEPGRAMVAAAGTLETRIKTVRRDKREVFLNDGIYGGLMEVYQFPALRPAYKHECGTPSISTCAEWTVFGPTCDPIDMLPFKLSMPDTIKENDIVRFIGIGAYCNATATGFNGYGQIGVKLAP